MENPMKNSIAPHSIVMSYPRCDYCGQQDTRYNGVHDKIGIKSCDEHYKLAKRDCNAYLHSTNRVRLLDKHPVISKFRCKMQASAGAPGVNFCEPVWYEINQEDGTWQPQKKWA